MEGKSGAAPKDALKGAVPPVLREVSRLAAGVAAVATTGSATGNPRNKYALQPGHSLMDWIRLGASGRDLSGVGPMAGRLAVSPRQLAEHNTREDAWIAIQGRVYNVTEYLNFHPGGPEELLRGVGKDATKLFNEVHAWVNYESILQKCHVGVVGYADGPSKAPSSLLEVQRLTPQSSPPGSFSLRTPSNPEFVSPRGHLQTVSTASSTPDNISSPSSRSASKPASASASQMQLQLTQPPRFDWIQKTDRITVFFYTLAYSNPSVDVCASDYNDDDDCLRVVQAHVACGPQASFIFTMNFLHRVVWPCRLGLNLETGKVEMDFKKREAKVWSAHGTMDVTRRHTARNEQQDEADGQEYVVTRKSAVNHNTFLVELERTEKCAQLLPIGYHFRVKANVNGLQVSRSYTPVPSCLFESFSPQACQEKGKTSSSARSVTLMVKRYPDGIMSKHICDLSEGQTLTLSEAIGSFKLTKVEKREVFLILAAGTGITPMFNLIIFILTRRMRRSRKIKLLFFNKKEEDILFKEQFASLEECDDRFSVEHVLSEPNTNWGGLSGYVSCEMVQTASQDLCESVYLSPQDAFYAVCGPTIFTQTAEGILDQLNISNDQVHCFLG